MRLRPEPELRNPFAEALSEIGAAFGALHRASSSSAARSQPAERTRRCAPRRSELESA